jgi:hypothetical protein
MGGETTPTSRRRLVGRRGRDEGPYLRRNDTNESCRLVGRRGMDEGPGNDTNESCRLVGRRRRERGAGIGRTRGEVREKTPPMSQSDSLVVEEKRKAN